MSARHSRTAALTGATAALIAAGTLVPTHAQAAAGTPAPAGSYAFTAHLEIGDGDNRRACSGALIDAYRVVTAASCFAADPRQPSALTAGAPTLKTTATIGRTNLTSTTTGHTSDVVELIPHTDRDLVVARLSRPATGITPVPLATAAPAPGDRLTVAGYGRTKTQWRPNTLHTAAFTLNSTTGTALNISGASANDAICKGDTGAPILRERSGGFELAGVASRSWQGGCLGESETRTDAIASRTDNTTIGTRLSPGQTILPGDALTSATARLTMGTDGNLTLTSLSGKTLWSTGTSGNPGAHATLDTTGNLTVRHTDGTLLWESKTTAPGGHATLQDRGNLTLHNAQGHPLWSTGTAIRRDHNRDGRSDLATWYDYGDGSDALHTFPALANGTFPKPEEAWNAPASFDAARTKPVTGDFDGDGTGDIAAVYANADGRVALWTWKGKGDGTFSVPLRAWIAEPGEWNPDRMTPHSGDFNGDGRDDLAALYGYADGSEKLWTFTSTAAGFTQTGSWSSTTWGDWNRTTLHAGDFDGDGRDDAAAWYDFADGRDVVHVFPTSATGTFKPYYQAWNAPAGDFDTARLKAATGDFNGDGRDDLAALYNFADGNIGTLTWTTRADGKLNAHTPGWTNPATSWSFNRTTLLNQQQ